MSFRVSGITEAEIRRRSPDATIRGGNGPDETRKWSNAQPKTVGNIKFVSRTEARVFVRLCEMYGRDKIRRQVRMPLVSGAPKTTLVPLYITIDFALVGIGPNPIWIDAKTNRKGREWARGKSLFEATWGTIIEWDGTGDFPEVEVVRE